MVEYQNKYKIGMYDKSGKLIGTYWSKTHESKQAIEDWTKRANTYSKANVKLLDYKSRSQAEMKRPVQPRQQTNMFGMPRLSTKGQLPKLFR
jgi:cobyric acid synthase